MDKIAHIEIPSTDLARSSLFYSKLFGWKMEPMGDGYITFTAGTGMGGGISKVKKTPGEGVVAYVLVKDISAALAKAVELGARVVIPVTEIGGGWGHWAQFKDPGGCTGVALWFKK
jgi:predicted enzyme related to lactoylglutathione lyase